MAYPYYQPAAPYPNYYTPTIYQPQMPQVLQTQQPQIQQPQTSGIIWISGLMEAQAYPIAPNNAVALWEKSGKTIYLKQADATGKPSITIYDLVERTESAQDGSIESAKPMNYATKEELSIVVGAVKSYDEILSALKADMETLKSDMYGIAGKKKNVKKESADDE